jgi:hypothetical protein
MLAQYSYRAFVIKEQLHTSDSSTNFVIYKNKKLFSSMCFTTPEVAAKIIDKHLRICRHDPKEEIILILESDVQSRVCNCGCDGVFYYKNYSKQKFINGHNKTKKFRNRKY